MSLRGDMWMCVSMCVCVSVIVFSRTGCDALCFTVDGCMLLVRAVHRGADHDGLSRCQCLLCGVVLSGMNLMNFVVFGCRMAV